MAHTKLPSLPEGLVLKQWRDTKYFVSENAEIVNKETNRILKQVDNRRGYLKIKLTHKGIQNSYFVHRIVAETYLGANALDINHIDGNRYNNRLSNLEYVNDSQNQVHSFKLGLRKYKLNSTDHEKILALYSNGTRQCELARIYNVTTSHISNIVNRKTATLGFIRRPLKSYRPTR